MSVNPRHKPPRSLVVDLTDPSADLRCGQHSHSDVILDEITHHQVVAELGEVHGRVLVFGQDVAVSSILQQESHYVCVPSFTGLTHSRGNITRLSRSKYVWRWTDTSPVLNLHLCLLVQYGGTGSREFTSVNS